jgi:hypothetical protein
MPKPSNLPGQCALDLLPTRPEAECSIPFAPKGIRRPWHRPVEVICRVSMGGIGDRHG